MTSVIANKIGLDLVDVQVEQSGKADTDMFFQEPVLDHSKDYVVAVSELSVPLGNESMLTKNSMLQKQTFLEIRAKRSGGQMNATNHALAIIPDGRARFVLMNRKIMTPVDLIHNISQWLYTFEQYASNDQMKISLMSSPSGILRFRGSALFWRNFAIYLGDFDNANEYSRNIIGYEQNWIGAVLRPDGMSTAVEDILENVGGVISFREDHGGYADGVDIVMKYSIYRYAEHRLRIEMDADLAIPTNILVDNGIQKIHYNIASFALPQLFEGRITVGAQANVEEYVSHVTHLFAGNTVVKRKETPTTDWYTLASAANVQNMRLHILVVRREFNASNNQWTLVRNKLTLDDGLGNMSQASWYATLKFVQTF